MITLYELTPKLGTELTKNLLKGYSKFLSSRNNSSFSIKKIVLQVLTLLLNTGFIIF